MINNILSLVHNKLLVGGLFCDFQRAFDCLNHEILLSNMRFYGILDIANKLIKSYLQDRYQRVLLNIENSNKYFSEWEQLKHGVPQGSILGPLFVLLYINNLSKIISDKFNSVVFADDTSMIIKNSNPLEFRNNSSEGFREINEWLQGNLLPLNYDKTYFFAICN